jgi:hypothetical protein
VLGEPDHGIGQQLQRPAGPPRGRLRAGGGDKQRLFLAGQLPLGPGPPLVDLDLVDLDPVDLDHLPSREKAVPE